MAYTTIEQSKRLIEIGIDPETADATNHDTPGQSWGQAPVVKTQ